MARRLSSFSAFVALEVQDGLEAGNGFLADAFLAQFGIDSVAANFVHFVDGDGDVCEFVGIADGLGDACQDFPVVDEQPHADVQAAVDFINHLDEFRFVQEGVAAHDVHVALVKFAVASFLRPVGAPHGLYLVAFEGEREFALVLHDKPREGHGQVIAQAFLRNAVGQADAVAFREFVVRDGGEEVPGVQDFEQQLVTFLPVFAHEGGEVLHGGGFERQVAVEFEHAFDGVEYVVAFHHDVR